MTFGSFQNIEHNFDTFKNLYNCLKEIQQEVTWQIEKFFPPRKYKYMVVGNQIHSFRSPSNMSVDLDCMENTSPRKFDEFSLKIAQIYLFIYS